MSLRTLLVAAATFSATVVADKRGLAFNDGINVSGFHDTFIALSAISWTYNWDSDTSNNDNYGEFVPMLWSPRGDHAGPWNDHVNKWLGRGTQYLLGFNEPDRPDQANMSPGDAVYAWRQYMEPYHSRAYLGAPAVSNGGFGWLQDFLNQCQGCHLDFIPVHWYGDHSQEADFENWVNRVCDLVAHNGRKVWITEFKGWGNEHEQIAFLKKAIPFLDNNSCVERYSYFGINNSNKDLIVGNGPNVSNLGVYYGYKIPIEDWP